MEERMNVTNQYVEYVAKNQSINPYPRGGSNGIYTVKLAEVGLILTGGALKLLLLIIADINDYGQTIRTRTSFNKAMGIKPNKSRMSRLMKELIDNKCVSMFDKTITVNPFLVLPKTSNVKIKAILQNAWLDLVEFA